MNPSLKITICHHSTSLIMSIVDPWDGFFLYQPYTYDIFLYLHCGITAKTSLVVCTSVVFENAHIAKIWE